MYKDYIDIKLLESHWCPLSCLLLYVPLPWLRGYQKHSLQSKVVGAGGPLREARAILYHTHTHKIPVLSVEHVRQGNCSLFWFAGAGRC